MKNSVLTAAFVLLSTIGFAQDKSSSLVAAPKEPAKMEKSGHGCMMADSKAIADLKLTAAQQTKVESILANCSKECNGMKEGDAKKAETMSKYQDEIKNVLTPEQFVQWKASCDASEKEHNMMHKEHMDSAK